MTDSNNCAESSNRIKKLPPLLVNQLAAGEVVTRPASVVKELIENAIDAGSKNIEIRITQGGMGIIEVMDDGCGIHPDDMIMAVTRFATSKIADVAHLQGIATLGFRGEALAATAAVSRLTLKSSCDASGIGRELTVAGIIDDTPELVPIVHPRGTTVTVKDLYFNVPARRGNLKSISTEFAQIEAVVKQLALVACDISFSLWHNDKRRFNFPAIDTLKDFKKSEIVNASNQVSDQASEISDNLKEFEEARSASSYSMPTVSIQSMTSRLKAVIPNPMHHSANLDESNLQPIDINLTGLHAEEASTNTQNSTLCIKGFLIPSYDTSLTTIHKLIYINGRLVKDRRIAQCLRESTAILKQHRIDATLNKPQKNQTNKANNIKSKSQDSIAADNLNTTGEHLGYILFFNLPNSWLNLNVHPSKQTIKIQNLANIMAHLEVGIRDTLNLWLKQNPYQVDTTQLTSSAASESETQTTYRITQDPDKNSSENLASTGDNFERLNQFRNAANGANVKVYHDWFHDKYDLSVNESKSSYDNTSLETESIEKNSLANYFKNYTAHELSSLTHNVTCLDLFSSDFIDSSNNDINKNDSNRVNKENSDKKTDELTENKVYKQINSENLRDDRLKANSSDYKNNQLALLQLKGSLLLVAEDKLLNELCLLGLLKEKDVDFYGSVIEKEKKVKLINLAFETLFRIQFNERANGNSNGNAIAESNDKAKLEAQSTFIKNLKAYSLSDITMTELVKIMLSQTVGK